jgi:hypothetical protein
MPRNHANASAIQFEIPDANYLYETYLGTPEEAGSKKPFKVKYNYDQMFQLKEECVVSCIYYYINIISRSSSFQVGLSTS